MLYPIFKYNDGTEVTASKLDSNGRVLLYVEKFNQKKDAFVNATIVLPDGVIESSSGHTKKNLTKC